MAYHSSVMRTIEADALIITSAHTHLIEVPVPVSQVDSTSEIAAWQVLAVCLRTKSGLEGWGYQTGFGAVMPVVRQFMTQEILPQIIGKDALEHSSWWRQIYLNRHHIGLNGPTLQGISAPEIAAWDLIAQASELPLWKLLGAGPGRRVRCYNTDVGWLGFSIDQLITNAKRAIDEGFAAIKIKIGSDDFSDDIRRLEALRRAIGIDITIGVDVNSRWDLQKAIKYAPDLPDFGIAWLEEPLHPFDVQGYARLSKAISTPILHGESICDPLMFRDMIKAGGMDIAQPSNMKLGGISRWLQVASYADTEGLRIVPAGWTMMQIDQHLAASTAGCWMIEWIPWIRDLFTEPVSFKDGYITIPDAPGASTRIKPELLE